MNDCASFSTYVAKFFSLEYSEYSENILILTNQQLVTLSLKHPIAVNSKVTQAGTPRL